MTQVQNSSQHKMSHLSGYNYDLSRHIIVCKYKYDIRLDPNTIHYDQGVAVLVCRISSFWLNI